MIPCVESAIFVYKAVKGGQLVAQGWITTLPLNMHKHV